jgi:hypothetical protein
LNLANRNPREPAKADYCFFFWSALTSSRLIFARILSLR